MSPLIVCLTEAETKTPLRVNMAQCLYYYPSQKTGATETVLHMPDRDWVVKETLEQVDELIWDCLIEAHSA
jgi:hypothetical protein